MIGGATMGAVLPPATPPSEPASSAASAATEPSSQPPNTTSSDPASAKPAKTASNGQASRTQSSGDDKNEFDRLLEPEAAPAAATTDATAKPGAADETRPTAASTPGPQDPSLADQLLGLLGLLGVPATATPATATHTATADAAAPPASAPATAATPSAMPMRALAQPASAAGASVAPPATATDVAHAMPGAAIAAESIVDRAPRDAPVPAGSDLTTMAVRDPATLVAPTPLPTPAAALPAVPQPALVQPASPDAGYGDDLGSSVVWMAEHRVGHAALQVSPDHLGPIEVRLQIDGARVHAEFFSAQPEVRHALEASLPRLRELLGQQGLQLGQADVGQRQRHDTPRAQSSGNGQGDCFPDDPRPMPATLRRARGLVDEYA